MSPQNPRQKSAVPLSNPTPRGLKGQHCCGAAAKKQSTDFLLRLSWMGEWSWSTFYILPLSKILASLSS